MIIKKTLNLEVGAGVSVNGASGYYMNVEIREDSKDLSHVMDDVNDFLLHYLEDINKSLTSNNGIYIHLYTKEVEHD